MESKNITAEDEFSTPRVTFRDLDDVKNIMIFAVDDLEDCRKAAAMLASLGTPINARPMFEARKDARRKATFVISVYQEFKRLHVNCDCSVTDDQIDQAITDMRQMVREIDDSENQAIAMGPVDMDPIAMLGSILGRVPGMPDGGQSTDGPVSGVRDASAGTGMYL
jgi:hypothetical protein